jgi:hypothetical protein
LEKALLLTAQYRLSRAIRSLHSNATADEGWNGRDVSTALSMPMVNDSSVPTFRVFADAGNKPLSISGIYESDLPVFNQDWWIEIARGSLQYREVKVFKGDVVVGKLPYLLSRNLIGLSRIRDPLWSHFGGPVVDKGLSRSEQTEVVRLLLRQLPRRSSVYFVCNSNASYWELVRDVFVSEGFQHDVQLNYVRRPTGADVMDTRKSKHNKHIQRAAKKLDCMEISAEEFVRFYKANLKAKGKKSYSPPDVVKRLIEEGYSRGQVRAIAARQKYLANEQYGDSREILYDAAIVYVWDHFRCYYWLSTCRVPSTDSSQPKPHPDAIKLLGMKAMEHAQAMKLIFDADGITSPGSENLYRNMFGLREKEIRDIFKRTTAAERLFQKCRKRIRKIWGSCASLNSAIAHRLYTSINKFRGPAMLLAILVAVEAGDSVLLDAVDIQAIY